MIQLGFDALWSAIPYPAFLLGPQNRIEAANPAAEGFTDTSSRHLIGRPLERFIGADSTLVELTAQSRRSGVPVAQYNVMVGWGDQAPQLYNIHVAPLQEARD